MTLCVNVQIGDRIAFLLECLAGVEHCVVLDLGSDDVLLAARRATLHIAADGEVIGLRTAAGEDDLGRVLCVQCTRNLHARFGDRTACLAANAVERGRVAVKLGQKGLHCLKYRFGHGRGRRVVRVDKTIHMVISSLWSLCSTLNIHQTSMHYQA